MGPREIIAQRIVASGALPPGATVVLSDPPPCGLGDRWREIIDGAERAHADGDGIPPILNRWLTLTTESLAANEAARRQIAQQQQGKISMTKIGTKEAALGAQRAQDASPTTTGPAPAAAPNGAGAPADKPTTAPKAAAAPSNKKIHPADAANLEAIAAADHFTVSIFHDRKNQHWPEKLPDLLAARQAGHIMKTELKAQRDYIVYAVLKDGRSFPVPRDYQAPTTQETTMAKATTAAKKSSTTKPVAKSSARAKPKAKAKPRDGDRAHYDWKGAAEKAAQGKVPSVPDFSAETHARFRPALAEVKKLVDAKDVAALKKWKYDGFAGTSVKSILRYRDLAVTALSATPKA